MPLGLIQPLSTPLGKLIGRYRLEEPLGEGGMGVVFRARDVGTDELVALKVVRVTDEGMLASFRREVFALRSIEHPSVVPILDDGVSDGQPWYAMPLLEGRTLGDYICNVHQPLVSSINELRDPGMADTLPPPAPSWQSPRGLQEVLSLMRALCAPLGFVHSRGLVHRDLKPDNVFVQDDGTPVLVDFGLALSFSGDRGRDVLEVAGRPLGTPQYMAPEQIRGDLVDARADLYALGCILYEALTGRLPFEGSTPRLLSQHMFAAPEPPSSVAQGIPAVLDELVLKLLEKNPRQRLGYADDVARALAEMGARVPYNTAQLPAASPYLYRPSLAGRDAMVSELQSALEPDARAKQGIVLIGGESGVGKTRVAMELATWVARSGRVRVVTGECLDLGAGTDRGAGHGAPLHPFRELLLAIADRCRIAGEAETEQILGERGKVLAGYEPSLRELPGQSRHATPPQLPADAARFRVMDALATTMGEMAEIEPLLLVLDDLQWADELSLAVLRYLDDGYFEHNQVTVLGTFRSDELTERLQELISAPSTVHVALGMLDREAVAAMVGDMLAMQEPPDSLIDFLLSQSDGNPFFIAEYLRVAIGESILRRSDAGVWRVGKEGESLESLRSVLPLPGSVRELVARRLGSMDTNTRHAASVASVFGREFDGDLVLHTLNDGEHSGLAALEELRRCQVIEEGETGRLRFVHDKVREVVYESIDDERRPEIHHQVARSIEQHVPEPERGRHYPELAHHFSRGGVIGKALEYLERAGEQALSSSTLDQAQRFYEQALELSAGSAAVDPVRRACWRRRLGQACYAAGDLRAARKHTLAALEALTARRVPIPRFASLGDPSSVRAVWRSLRAVGGQAATLLGKRRQREISPQKRIRLREASLAAERLSQIYFFLNSPNHAFGAALQAADLAEELGPSPELARGYAVLSVGFGYVPMPALVQVYADRAERIAERTGDAQAIAFVAFLRALNLVGAGQHRAARRALERSVELARDMKDVRAEQEYRAVLSAALRIAGELDLAIEECDKLESLAQRSKNAQGLSWAHHGRALCFIGLGDADEAVRLLEQDGQLTAETGDRSQLINHGNLAYAYLIAGEHKAARGVAERTLELIEGDARGAFHLLFGYEATCEVLFAHWEAERGDRAVLETLAHRAVRALTSFAQLYPLAQPYLNLFRGLLKRLSGKSTAARRDMERGLRKARELQLPVLEARFYFELGRCLPPTETERHVHLEEAYRRFEALNAGYWLRRCRAEGVGPASSKHNV